SEPLQTRFLRASTPDRLRLVADPENQATLRDLLGEEALADYAALSGKLDDQHLAAGSPPNLLFVPGVMGSLLDSESKGGVWWVDVRDRNHLNDLALSPDGASDKNAEDDVRPFNVDTSYEPFLTAALRRADVGHRTFPYDWRKLLTRSVDQLVVRVDDLQAQN